VSEYSDKREQRRKQNLLEQGKIGEKNDQEKKKTSDLPTKETY
jgi:hypothetical protein